MDYIEKKITAEQFYSEDGNKLMRLEAQKTALLNKQGYYSKGVARLGNRIVKLKIKMGLLVERTLMESVCDKCQQEMGIRVAINLRSRMSNLLNPDILIINDTDDTAWGSGLADWLMKNFNYANLKNSLRINLAKPKIN